MVKGEDDEGGGDGECEWLLLKGKGQVECHGDCNSKLVGAIQSFRTSQVVVVEGP